MGKLEFWAAIFASAAMTVAPMLFPDLAPWVKWALFVVGVVGFLSCAGLAFAQRARRRKVMTEENKPKPRSAAVWIEDCENVEIGTLVTRNIDTAIYSKGGGRLDVGRLSATKDRPIKPPQIEDDPA